MEGRGGERKKRGGRGEERERRGGEGRKGKGRRKFVLCLRKEKEKSAPMATLSILRQVRTKGRDHICTVALCLNLILHKSPGTGSSTTVLDLEETRREQRYVSPSPRSSQNRQVIAARARQVSLVSGRSVGHSIFSVSNQIASTFA